MAEEATTTSASDADQSTSGDVNPGAADDGSARAQAAADALAAERERAEAQRRDLQAAKDREAARAAALERELAALKNGTSTSDAPAPITLADLRRMRELDRAAESFKTEFPEADSAILARADEYDSPESFRADVERSHKANAELKDRYKREAEEAIKARLKEAGLELPAEPSETAPTTTDAPNGDPTPAMLKATPVHLWKDNGWTNEVVDRVLSKHNSEELFA